MIPVTLPLCLGKNLQQIYTGTIMKKSIKYIYIFMILNNLPM